MPKKLRTKDLCREALEQTGWVLQYVPDCFKTKKICMAVVKDCGEALGGVPKRWRTKDLCLAAVRNGGHLYDVPDALLTPELLEVGKNAFSS